MGNAFANTAIDMGGSRHGRGVALGTLLGRLPELEMIGERRGVALYRLRNSGR